MIYYKSKTGEVYAYDQEQIDLGLADDKVALTDAEAEAHKNPVPTAEQLQAQINTEASAYLSSTDWYVIRMQETGEPVPEDILAGRAAARARVVE